MHPAVQKKNLTVLVGALRAGDPTDLEKLGRTLLSRLIETSISLARSGFQHGGDGGTAGRNNRHLRIECKRYGDKNRLDDRELRGEVDDALELNPGLEAWVLIATRPVDEITREKLRIKADKTGVPAVVIDWDDESSDLPDLAALCAWAPDVVATIYGSKAARAARALTSVAAARIIQLRRDLEHWQIGYENIRLKAQERLSQIWAEPVASQSAMGQDAAGGSRSDLIERKVVMHQLRSWWASPTSKPLVAHGSEGVGKTWAVLGWAMQDLAALPICLALPSSAFAEIRGMSQTSVIDFLALMLRDVVRGSEAGYWRQRLERMLERPKEDGPCLLLIVDGLNQEPSIDWIHFVQILQAGIFNDRVRVVLTTQTRYLDNTLDGMRYVLGGVELHGIEAYDSRPGGELDEMLAKHRRTREGFSPELIELARVPRLFPIALKLSEEANIHGQATPTRLLWAYGRGQVAMRERRAFSEREWEAWLRKLAIDHWDVIKANGGAAVERIAYTPGEINEQVRHVSSRQDDTLRRLEEIVDDRWMEPVPHLADGFRPKESTILLALGIDLVANLEGVASKGLDRVFLSLAEWLDPAAATSAAADVLAAALSIAVHKKLPPDSPVTRALVVTLLQSQNVTDEHRRDVVALATALSGPLLHAVEGSLGRAQASARAWALEALRTIPTSNEAAWARIYDQMVSWVAHVTGPDPHHSGHNEESNKYFSDRLVAAIGSAEHRVHEVMGVPIRVHGNESTDLAAYVPELLLGKPLVPALKVLVATAVTSSIGLSANQWTGFEWLVLLNPIDRTETVSALRAMSIAALTEVVLEEGVRMGLPTSVARRLLWLTLNSEAETVAAEMADTFHQSRSYQDYLDSPGTGSFPLERRHAGLVLMQQRQTLWGKLGRLSDFIGDPTLNENEAIAAEATAEADAFDVSKLKESGYWGHADHTLERLLPGLARFAPAAVARLGRRFLLTLEDRVNDARQWASHDVRSYFLLSNPDTVRSAEKLLSKGCGTFVGGQETIVSLYLLEIIIAELPLGEQLDQLVASEAFLTIDLLEITQEGAAEDIGRFMRRHDWSHRRVREVLVNYLSMHPVTDIDELVFSNVLALTEQESDSQLRVLAFMALTRSTPERFGRTLLERGWRASPAAELLEQENGSIAVLAAASGQPLSELVDVVAPWTLLGEIRRRGGQADLAALGAITLGRIIRSDIPTAPPKSLAVTVDTRRPLFVSFEQGDGGESDSPTPEDLLNANRDLDMHRNAQEVGKAYMERFRTERLGMGIHVVPVEDARLLIEYSMSEVERWLDGMESGTSQFVNRLNGAGGLYLALCEALLQVNSPKAVPLWHAIDAGLRISYRGVGDINELRHMPFRAGSTAACLELRELLYGLGRNENDQVYLELVVCAKVNGAEAWLRQKIDQDKHSPDNWRHLRAITIEGLIGDEKPATELAWLSGPVITTVDEVRRIADMRSNTFAIARHWWQEYWNATEADDAFCCWVLFCAYVDRRALAWMHEVTRPSDVTEELHRMKHLNIEVNSWEFHKAMKANEKRACGDMTKRLFGQEQPGEWFEMERLAAYG